MPTDTLSKLASDNSSSPDTAVSGQKLASVEIVVISLPTAIERRRKIEAVFDGTGLTWSYFDAHNSLNHPGLRYDVDEIKRKFGRTLSIPEIAVCSSHVAVLDEFLQRGSSEYILVL